MRLGLGITLNRGAFVGGALDPDASAYIAAVEAAGATVTVAQKNAINSFITTGKSDGWWSGLYRFYFPIWGGADAPNIIDMIDLGNATLPASHTLTWASGYVTGSGTNATGVFRDNANLQTFSHSTSSSFFGCLIAIAPTNSGMGMGSNDGTTSCDVQIDPTAGNTFVASRHFGASRVVAIAQTVYNGIFTSSRTSTSLLTYRRRNGSGSPITIGTNTAASGGVPNNVMGYCGRRTVSNNNDNASNGSFGAFFTGDGLSEADTDKLTLAVKTLWETCTGLTLP